MRSWQHASCCITYASHRCTTHEPTQGLRFGDALNAILRRLAKREGIPLNQAALKLLRKGAGLTDDAGRSDTVGSSLDHLIGTWTATDADEMDSTLEDFESIDESAWK